MLISPTKQEEIDSLAKDVGRFKRFVYLAREPLFTSLQSALPSAQILQADKPILDVEWDNAIALLYIYHQTTIDSTPVIRNMFNIKRKNILICTFCDSYSWGWVSRFTDYRYIISNEQQMLEIFTNVAKYFMEKLNDIRQPQMV